MPKSDTTTEPKRQNVILAFRITEDDDLNCTVSLLTSYGGVRVFTYPDGVDPRVGKVEDIPLMDSWDEAQAYLLEEPGSHRPVFVPYPIAQMMFSHEDFADFTIDGLDELK